VDALNSADGTSVLHDAAAGGYTSILRALVDAARKQLKKPKAGGDAGKEAPAAEGAAEVSGGGGGDKEPAAAAGGEEGGGEEGGDGPAAPRTLGDLINHQDSEGETALHNAARGNHVEAVRFLLALGADPFIAANDGTLPVEEPEDEGVAAIVQAAMDAIEEGGEEGDEEGGEEEGAAGAGEGEKKAEEEEKEPAAA
jgi:hypothetical protein